MKPFSARAMLCLVLAVLIASPAHARGKKKGMEPKICKRGKLIFEDDFSGRELLWTINHPDSCQWKVVKRALVTESVGSGAKMSITRAFAPAKDIIIELRMLIPTGAMATVGFRLPEVPTMFISPGSKFSLGNWSAATGVEEYAVSPLPLRKPKWLSVVYETIGSQHALSVDGRTITCERSKPENLKCGEVYIGVNKKTSDIAAIDDVKVYEALPKDEDDDKDKKGKKR